MDASALPDDAPAPPRVVTRGLPPHGRRRLLTLLTRAMRRRCPYCGAAGIFKDWFALRERCPACGVSFEREEGYFLGAYAVNLLLAEFLGLGLALLVIFGTSVRDAAVLWKQLISIAFAVALPLLCFPFSRTLWMALDLYLDPPERQTERRLRGQHMHWQ